MGAESAQVVVLGLGPGRPFPAPSLFADGPPPPAAKLVRCAGRHPRPARALSPGLSPPPVPPLCPRLLLALPFSPRGAGLAPTGKRHTTGTACIGAGVERGGPVRAALPREKLILGPSLPAPSLSSARGRLPKHPGGPASLWRKGMMEPYLVPRLPPSFLWDLHRRQSARRSGVKVMHRHLHGCCVQRGSASLSPRDPLRLHVCRCQSYRRK